VHFACQQRSRRRVKPREIPPDFTAPSDAGNLRAFPRVGAALGSCSRLLKLWPIAEELVSPVAGARSQIARKFFLKDGAAKIVKAEYANNIGNADFFVADTV